MTVRIAQKCRFLGISSSAYTSLYGSSMRSLLGAMMSVVVFAVACNGTTTADEGEAAVGKTSSPIVLTQLPAAPKKGLEQLMNFERDAVAKDALAFLHAQRAELGMRSPEDELRVIHAHVDDLAMTHVRFHQIERGIRVDGGNVNAHFDPSGRLATIEKRYVPGLSSLSTTPGLGAEDAGKIAIAHRQPESHNQLSVVGTPELVIFARDWVKTPVLVWQVEVKGSRMFDWTVRVDAQTGAVVHAASRLHALQGTGRGLDGQTHPVNFIQDSGTNILVDQTHTAEIDYFDAKNSISDPSQVNIISSNSASSWDASSSLGRGAAVSAQQTIGATVDFYQKTFQRAGWLGDSSAMPVIIHQPDDDGTAGMDNAFYAPAPDNFIAIGDGKQIFKPLAQFIDVLAHEFTHGVTGAHANLNEDPQPNALNESISDCFGAIIEHSFAPDPVKNWQMGEGSLAASNAAMRDLAHPGNAFDGPQPSNFQQFDNSADNDPHANGGITNNAAYLATMGGTNDTSKIVVKGGIGWDNFAKVWYRADTVYLTETSTFADMAAATMKAAADLKLSEADTDTLDCAWKAVGVTQGACKTPAATTQSETPATSGATTAGDDDDDSSTTKPSSKKKKSSSSSSLGPSASASAGCNATGSSADASWLVLALGALVTMRRRRQPR